MTPESIETVNVRQMWLEPKEYGRPSTVESGTPLTEIYDKGMLVRMTESGTVLEVLNRTHEEALEEMQQWP